MRVPATFAAVRDPSAYEAFRDGGWRKGAAPSPETWRHLRDVDTGKAVRAHGGSVFWNEYRKRWVAIVLETGEAVITAGMGTELRPR